MEVFGHFVFPRFSGFFRAFSFVYRLFRAFLFTILFRHFVLPPIFERFFIYSKFHFLINIKGYLSEFIEICTIK